MAERNFYGYQIDFQEIRKDENQKEYYRDFWNATHFKELVADILDNNPNDIKQIHNGWFILLDQIDEYAEKYLVNGKEEEHNYLVGRFLYAEYGYVGKLRHVDTLAQRDNNKLPREGEEKFVYFYLRQSDGLLLLQGDMKVIRSKVEDYFAKFGKEYMENHDIHDLSIRTLLRGDFIDEVNRLDEVSKIEIELAVEKTNSFENELMTRARQQAKEFEANYATIIMQSKYKKDGLKKIGEYIEKIKPRGTTAPIKGVNNIKVIGKQEGEFKRVYLSKISEKYTLNVEVDEKKNIDSDDLYNKVKDVGRKREELWRDE
ncbi:hypothetical protein ACQCVH_22350 [Bacillus infantis]|uniref:hypothetical protein n=1 Tax=Bacillus infantis TaxID=324767 RepID=UPI003CF4B4ED